MKGKLNQQLWKKQNNIYISNLETCNSSTLWTFSVWQLVLIGPWRLTRLAKRKGYSRANSLIVQKTSRVRHFHHTTSSSADCNPLDEAYSQYQSIVNSGCSSEEVLKKLRVSWVPPTRQEKYAYLLQVWKNNDMQSFKDFLRWCNNKDVVPTLEAMKKKIEFYHSTELICWRWVVRYQISQTFVFIALQTLSFTLSRKETKTCLKK